MLFKRSRSPKKVTKKLDEVVQNREYPVARDENDMLMDLIEEENKPGDDLAELRRMIN